MITFHYWEKVAPQLGVLTDLEKRMKFAYRNGWARVGRALSGDFVGQVMFKPKHGRVYRMAGGIHVASAWNETPANLTGHYRDSIEFKVRGWNGMVWGNNALYADWLEKGSSEYNVPFTGRKGLWRTVKKIQPTFVNIFDAELAKEFGGFEVFRVRK